MKHYLIFIGIFTLGISAFNWALAGLYGNVEYEGPYSPVKNIAIAFACSLASSICFYCAGRWAGEKTKK